jgi:hypothetical protein
MRETVTFSDGASNPRHRPSTALDVFAATTVDIAEIWV